MTLDALIADAGRRALRVNNLFQRHDDTWQANLRRDGAVPHAWASGETAAVALERALAGAADDGEDLLG